MSPSGWTLLVFNNCKILSVRMINIHIAKNSIDGSCLELIEEGDLVEDLGIANKIVRKKLMHCNKFQLAY